MKWSRALAGINWRLLIAAALTAGIVHICAIFGAPLMAGPTALARLAPALPLNRMIALPPISPDNQPLAYLAPDVQYAMCRFDATSAPLEIRFVLPEAGWTITVLTSTGETAYAASGIAQRPTSLTLLVVPSDDVFLGVTPEARGAVRTGEAPLLVTADRGLAVIRAPDKGRAYDERIRAELDRSVCGPAKL